MLQQELIGQLSKLDDDALSQWCHQALIETYVDPKPTYKRESGIDYLQELHTVALEPFQRRLRTALFALLLNYIDAIRTCISQQEIAIYAENIYFITLLFNKIQSFKNYRRAIGNLLLKESELLSAHQHGTLSLYGLLLNRYVLWSDGVEPELIENEKSESKVLTDDLINVINKPNEKTQTDLDIIIVGHKYFALFRNIADFFNYFEKFACLPGIDEERKKRNLANFLLYLFSTKKKSSESLLDQTFLAVIKWYESTRCEYVVKEGVLTAISVHIKNYDTDSEYFYALKLLMNDKNAKEYFERINGQWLFRSTVNQKAINLSNELFDIVSKKTNNILPTNSALLEGFEQVKKDMRRAMEGAFS